MPNITIIKLLLTIAVEVIREYKKAKKNDQIEEIKKDPNGWLANHFGSLRDDATSTSKANDKSSPK